MMKLKILIVVLLFGLMFSMAGILVSALEIRFYYSPTCQHCQNVAPLIQQLSQQYSNYRWYSYDVTQGSYPDIKGIPTIRIKGCNNYSVEIGGDLPIINQLPCELMQQSIPNKCITKPAYTKLQQGESWFVS